MVDDGSSDRTGSFLKSIKDERVISLFQEANQGKGAALRAGFQKATGDVILIQDADSEYNPEECGILLEPILDGRADVVYGSRFLGGSHRVLFFWHYVENKILTFLSHMMTNVNLTDLEACYKKFRRDVLQDIPLRCDRFGFEPEITAKLPNASAVYTRFQSPVAEGIAAKGRESGEKTGWLHFGIF